MVKALIYETGNFTVMAHDKPHVDRLDGGHIVIVPKVRVRDRTQLSPEQAKELMKLTMIVGEAMEIALNRRAIDIGRINYQDNGNWGVFRPEGPYLHVHLYGRAKSARIHRYGDALYLPHRETGFYDAFQPLNDGDVREIRNEIERIATTKKYQNF
jgi:diadenosine tetraphosphate (Ap4A) HIT family hydrolase